MWFLSPQMRGLGSSPTAQHYGVVDLAEARDYLEHQVLGTRLNVIGTAMLALSDRVPEAILGPVDAMKLHSSITLFQLAGRGPVFGRVLNAFYAGKRCAATLLEEDND